MLRKILAAIGLGVAASFGAAAAPPYSPYANPAANDFYNLLFCDDPAGYAAKPGQTPAAWQATLASDDVAALRSLASDAAQEGHIRYLAFSRLRAIGQTVMPKILLGVIVEVALDGGLDTLAAFQEGDVRYINHSGKLVVIDGVASLTPRVRKLFATTQPLVDQLGPADEARRAPPKTGEVRLTFLVSDGPYFGQAPADVMQVDAAAGPVMLSATELMLAVVAAGTAPDAAK
jgi:hypothetical protein